jgi:hypothetical protein
VFERFGRDDGGLAVPRDERLRPPKQFVQPLTLQSACREISRQSAATTERFDFVFGQSRRSPIRPGSNEHRRPPLQLFQPELDSAERVVFASGIDQDKYEVCIVEEQRMNQTVIWLSRKVPEDGLALDPILPARR